MSLRFEELDHRETAMGELVLRRRLEPSLRVDVYEVKLGDEYLMSSLFTVSETRLAELGLAAVDGDELDVVVGGLGLGFTARAVLRDARVRSLLVVEALPEVISWHERRLLPFATELVEDPRCRFVADDFFALVRSGGFPTPHAQELDVLLVDVDHSPRHHLHPSHASFYDRAGLRSLAGQIRPGGVFALWSDDPPDDEFMAAARAVFASCDAHVVTFPNPLTDGESSSTVYVARVASR